MGRQIAQIFAQQGKHVNATDENLEAVKAGLEEIANGTYGLNSLVERGKLSKDDAENVLQRINTVDSIENAVRDVDLAIEAVYENLVLKQEIFQRLDKASPENAILASNASTLSITKIAANVKVKERVIGLHFFNPAQITKLVEIVKSDQTSKQTVRRAFELVTSLGKTAILARDEPGFVANRLGLSLYIEASRMLEYGIANIKDIDMAMKLGYNHPMGPFELADFVGLDTRMRNLESMFNSTGDEKWIPPKILREMVNQGYLGDPKRKTGSKGGYYTLYEKKNSPYSSNPFIVSKTTFSQ